MAELTTVARPYAKAAFEAAQSQNKLADWSAMLSFCAAVAADEKIKVVLDNPGLTSTQKADAFVLVCGDKLSEDARRFVQVLAENKRLSVVAEISRLFEQLKSQLERSVDVAVESAFELTAEQQDKLAQALSKKLERQVNVSATTNKALLGGVIIRTEDLIIDASVRGKLAKLAESMRS
ncbi:MAG: F0F1 ATP synthase subunit delta [Hahellaceae bacterium]|nr:F0F1 ATP synthase subunit delta [Hahellaceae bacterium]